jgi:tetratricopeptide (TPR) repeat protein
LTYLKSNQPDKAIADFDAVLLLNPKLTDSLYGRGLALIKKRDLDRGHADTARAKAIDPDVVRRFDRYDIH